MIMIMIVIVIMIMIMETTMMNYEVGALAPLTDIVNCI